MSSELNIILDMDGTLIDDDGLGIPRPHLKDFLLYCFKTFNSVSIWTNASDYWYQEVYNKILKPILEKGNYNFYLVFTHNRSTLTTNKYYHNDYCGLESRLKYIKPLRKIWHAKTLYPNFNKHNTLIVDDTYHTYQSNYGNAIPIPTYYPNNKNDNYLLKLINYLKVLISIYENTKTIRYTEKRSWCT